jgi:hypothetical protein
MKFLAITLIVHAPHPITGATKPTMDRFREVIGNALLAEDLGFDGPRPPLRRPARAARGRGMTPAAAAADPGLARQRDQQGVG